MKKTIIIFLSVFYLILASGFTLNLHYCGGKLKDVSLFSNNEDGCCGSKKKSKGCCKNETTVVKVKDSHNSSNVAKLNSPNITLAHIIPSQLLFKLLHIDEAYVSSNYHDPPVLYDNPLYLKHRVLII